MKKKKGFVGFAIIVLTVVFVFSLAPGVRAGEKKGMPGKRSGAKTVSHFCVVPYNIGYYGYQTGLHLVSDEAGYSEFIVLFYAGGNHYAVTGLAVPAIGWTGTIEELLHYNGANPGINPVYPTLLYIFSYENPEHPGIAVKFWVDQFLFSSAPYQGFSHVVFTSSEYDD